VRLIEARLTRAVDRHFTRHVIAPCGREMAARVAFAYGARRAAQTDGIDTCDGDAIGSSLIIADGEFRATMEGKDEYLLQCLKEKIASGYDMIERLRLVDKIDGIDKLIRKIQQEIKFLEKARYTCDLVISSRCSK